MSVKKMSIELNSGQICETLQENKKILEKHQKVEADLIDDIFKEIGINHETSLQKHMLKKMNRIS